MRAMILAGTLLLAGGCGASSFAQRFAALEAGTTPQGVVELLGEPDARNRGVVPAVPYWGPSEGLSAILGAGATYEEWVWSRDGQDHYAWLAPEGTGEGGEWSVVLTTVYPSDAVFESGGPSPRDSASKTWSVVATDAGEREIEAIKAVREVTGLGLKDAKDLVDGTPAVVSTGLSDSQARDVAVRLEAAGMTIELRGP